VFGGIYAPSTVGSFLRACAHGHVRQLHAATSRFTAGLIGELGLLHDSDVVYLDIDSKVKQVYGPAKQGASFGYTKVRGPHFVLVAASTPHSRPVIVATRLRAGRAGSGRGAASLVKEAIRVLRAAGVTATILLRADSAFFSPKLVAACRDAADVHFSITVPNHESIRAAIATIPDGAWMPIKYRNAVWDEDERRWVSEAEIAGTAYTAFTSKKDEYQVTARLIVRRVKRLNPAGVPEGQGELFATWRHHGLFTDYRLVIEQAEPRHRQHAIIEQVFSDLEDGALATCRPGGSRPTPPGSCSPRLRSTSCALLAGWPGRSTPRPPAPPCAEPSSTPRPASPPAPAASTCTCPSTGPGPDRSTGCWPAPDTASRPADQRKEPVDPHHESLGDPATGRTTGHPACPKTAAPPNRCPNQSHVTAGHSPVDPG
jgi:hypothetical protein